jgi:uncharacterized protein YdhG (YjbR/CyaY superfamily)
MSFQAYLDNIKTKTGKTPEGFKKLGEKKGILNENTKAGDLIKWLKEEFDLGHGHSMAIWKSFQDNGWLGSISKKTIDKKSISKDAIENGKELVDKYIAGFPKTTQLLLEKMRATIKKAVPKAEETVGYGIPTFKLNGNLVHFGGYKNHIGFYPAPSAIKAFEKDLSMYDGAKGSVQFPVDKPLPLALVTKIVKYRVKENEAKKNSKVKSSII